MFADGDAVGREAAGEFERRMDAEGFPVEVRWVARGDAYDLLREGGVGVVEGRGSLVLVPSDRGAGGRVRRRGL